MTTIPLTTVINRGRGGGPSWSITEGLAVGVDSGCELRSLDARFSRCSSCPLPACWVEHSTSDRTNRAALVRRLGGVPPQF